VLASLWHATIDKAAIAANKTLVFIEASSLQRTPFGMRIGVHRLCIRRRQWLSDKIDPD